MRTNNSKILLKRNRKSCKIYRKNGENKQLNRAIIQKFLNLSLNFGYFLKNSTLKQFGIDRSLKIEAFRYRSISRAQTRAN